MLADVAFLSGDIEACFTNAGSLPEAVGTISLARSIAHGVAQGAMSVLQGGKFKHGFVSGFFGHVGKNLGTALGFGELGTQQGKSARTFIAALVGGTVSERTGGKFANGAMTAAIVHLYNADSSYNKRVKTGARFFRLEGDIEASLDIFEYEGESSFEYHIYKRGKEIGVYGPGGFVAKHGWLGNIPDAMTPEALQRLNGLSVDLMRSMGHLPAKGTTNIKSMFRGLGKALGVISFVGLSADLYLNPEMPDAVISDFIGIGSLGDSSLPYHDVPQF